MVFIVCIMHIVPGTKLVYLYIIFLNGIYLFITKVLGGPGLFQLSVLKRKWKCFPFSDRWSHFPQKDEGFEPDVQQHHKTKGTSEILQGPCKKRSGSTETRILDWKCLAWVYRPTESVHNMHNIITRYTTKGFLYWWWYCHSSVLGAVCFFGWVNNYYSAFFFSCARCELNLAFFSDIARSSWTMSCSPKT